jgi:hypothetical protein
MIQRRAAWLGCTKIKERYSDVEHHLFADIRDKTSLILYCGMKIEWVREAQAGCSRRNMVSGLA